MYLGPENIASEVVFRLHCGLAASTNVDEKVRGECMPFLMSDNDIKVYV